MMPASLPDLPPPSRPSDKEREAEGEREGVCVCVCLFDFPTLLTCFRVLAIFVQLSSTPASPVHQHSLMDERECICMYVVRKIKKREALAGFEPAISCLLDRRFNR